MLRKLRIAVIANVLLVLIFVYSNFSIWDMLNEHSLIQGSWTPWLVDYVGKAVLPGEKPLATGGLLISPNYPFWLFFLSTAVNLYLLIRLQRSKETKQNPS
jgi:hypothetical protein